MGETAALVEDEAVEGAEGEDLGVPVVEGHAVGLGYLGGWEAFHSRSVEGSVDGLVMELGREYLGGGGLNFALRELDSRQRHAFQKGWA